MKNDVKYLVKMLNNLEKISDVTINCQIDYIRTNFLFEIAYKKEKIFELNRLLRRKWYSVNPPLKRFEDDSDNKKEDIPILLGEDQEKIPLGLEEFYKYIDL